MSTVQRHLVEAFTGVTIHVNDLDARAPARPKRSTLSWITAKRSHHGAHRDRIGLTRIPRDVTDDVPLAAVAIAGAQTPSLQAYLAGREKAH